MEKKMEQPVLFEVNHHIARITLNRPEKRNAINRELLLHLYNCLETVSGQDDIRVAILTGNGKSFCAGIDLSVIQTENLFDPRGDGTDLPDIIYRCTKPIIGAINGHAITGGFELALNCDFLIASDRASFADTHSIVGIHPGWGMTQLLQQAVGRRMAKQLSFTGQFIGAELALQCGLVNEIVPHDQLIPRAEQIAAQICSMNQDILGKVKSLIEYKNHATLQEAFDHERSGFRQFVDGFGKKG
jgi:enoyl-CoA hydratase